jgi:porin
MPRRRRIPRPAVLLLLLTLSLLTPPAARAQLFEFPDTFGGDVWSRPRLTGRWGGLRDEMGKRGILLDVDLYQSLQGVASGGRDTGVGYRGSAQYTLSVDLQRAGLWPGGFLRVFGESSFGDSIQREAGGIVSVNGPVMFPVPNEERTTLSSIQFTQFLAPWMGVTVGMLDVLDADANEFADDYRTKFVHPAFEFNLVNARIVPYGPLGGGLVFVPYKGALLTALVVDPTGSTSDTAFDRVFEDGVAVTSEFRTEVKPFGLRGHQLLGFAWTNREFIALKQDPGNLLGRVVLTRFPRIGNILDPSGNTPLQDRLRQILLARAPALAGALAAVGPPRTVQDSWAVYYNFDQYLWADKTDPNQGIGLFFRAGVSDGKANPILHHFNVGLSGRGMIPGRPQDQYGIGWSRIDFSDDLFPLLREQLDLGLKTEDTFEAYYNFAITRAVSLTADVQVIDSALKRSVEPDGTLKKIDTAVIGGLRLWMRF